MKVPLVGGAYQARSVIANAQRCVNLFPETNTQDATYPTTHYPTPGLTEKVTGLDGPVRCLYAASNGDLYAAAGGNIYYIAPNWTAAVLGGILGGTTPVSMADNTLELVIVDGTPSGYVVNLSTRVMSNLVDPTGTFVGADRVDYMDTFLIFNKPGTPQFYSTLSGTVTFDALYFANKTGAPDYLSTLLVKRKEIWLLGNQRSSEVWYNAGGANFPFSAVPGAFIEHGCAAKYSAAKQDLDTYWLGIDQQGNGIVFKGVGYVAQRISTFAIEAAFQSYPTISDAVGFTYQQGGHAFYVLTFPTADKTWVYDASNEQWHEWAWADGDGALHRSRAMCAIYAYGKNLVGDWETGTIYHLNPEAYTDAGDPIVRVRSLPHLTNDGNRVSYKQFIADMEVGTMSGALLGADEPAVSLRWSDDRGQTWGTAVQQSLGGSGEYLTSVQWQRLGMARDRVFELSWSAAMRTALNGAYIDAQVAGS